jgi:hypothetical protein
MHLLGKTQCFGIWQQVVQAVTIFLQKAKTYHFLTGLLSIHKAFRNNIRSEEFISEIK